VADVRPARQAGGITDADLDAIFHGPRGYPKPSPEQTAEMVKRAEARLSKSSGVYQRRGRRVYAGRGVWR
jgi:hypothetical protein